MRERWQQSAAEADKEPGLWAGFVAELRPGQFTYRIRFGFPDGNAWELDDPYRFAPTLGEERPEPSDTPGPRASALAGSALGTIRVDNPAQVFPRLELPAEADA